MKVSEDEAIAFAHRLIDHTGSIKSDTEFIDLDRFLEVGLKGIDPRFKDALTKGIVTGFKEGGLIRRFQADTQDGGTAKLLRVREQKGFTSVLIRIVAGDGRHYYQEYALHQDDAGVVKAVDLRSLPPNEWFSEATQRDMKFLVKSLLALSPEEQQSEKAIQQGEMGKLQSFQQYSMAHDWQGVLDSYAALPEEVRILKLPLQAKFAAATRLARWEIVEETVQSMRKNYGDDPANQLCVAELCEHQKNYLGAIKALQKVNEWAGGDAVILARIGDLYQMAGDRETARREYEKAVELEPTLPWPRQSLVKIGVEASDFALAVQHVRELERGKHTSVEAIELEPNNAGLLASPEYQAWKASLK